MTGFAFLAELFLKNLLRWFSTK